MKLSTFENTTQFTHYIQSFNINTNHWSAQYIYKRLKFLGNRQISQLATLVFLAVWHGFHSGYYVCFFFEFVVVYMERDVSWCSYIDVRCPARNPRLKYWKRNDWRDLTWPDHPSHYYRIINLHILSLVWCRSPILIYPTKIEIDSSYNITSTEVFINNCRDTSHTCR